jgi:hypothetical protein
MKDGKMVVVTPHGENVVTLDGKKLEALKAELMEASVVESKAASKDSKDSKESTKYHVKRPKSAARAGDVIELDRVPMEAGLAATRARIMMADGVKLDGAVECNVITRDKQ